MMRIGDRPLLAAMLLAIAAQALFSLHLGRPSIVTFDETHYVPAARTMLALAESANVEHPPLGKQLIALGIAAFGDNPIGWRAMSTFAGTATVLGGFAILLLAFGRVRTALVGGTLIALNQTVFVQARIGMLDGFMAAFLVGGGAALLWAIRGKPERQGARLLLAGALFGAATAVKWAAAPYVAAACLVILWQARRRPWAALDATLRFGLTALIVYFATFLPMLFYAREPLTLAEIVPLQRQMYEAQTRILSAHPYQSDWWSWPLMLRPIWYFYEPDQGAVRGVLLIGNPVVMWGGLVGVLACLWAGWRGARAQLALAALWIGSVAIYAIIPKSLGFYYYYHLSGIWIALALAAALDWRGDRRLTGAVLVAAALAFAYFYPILSAAALPNDQAFNRWMWFDSWR